MRRRSERMRFHAVLDRYFGGLADEAISARLANLDAANGVTTPREIRIDA